MTAPPEKKPPEKGPFAALAALRDALPAGPARATPTAASAAVSPAAPSSTPARPFAGKVVVSRSRKGRGGRTVTVVAGVRGNAAALEEICRELKKSLGCGASVEGETIVVSGDLIARVKVWLEAAGATKVIVGT